MRESVLTCCQSLIVEQGYHCRHHLCVCGGGGYVCGFVHERACNLFVFVC